VPVVAGAAVAVIAVGIGIGFAVAAGSDNDKRTQLAAQHGTVGCSAPGSPLPDCAEQRMAASDYRTHRDISTAGFVVGAAAAAGAAVYWFWPRDTTARSSSGWTRTLRVGGAVVKDAGVVSLTGQF
jgi:hypothetical protein